jgi:hypothetical protein
MSALSIYLRDKVCRWLAKNIGDAKTQGALRRLADEYVARSVGIESKEIAGVDRLPHPGAHPCLTI